MKKLAVVALSALYLSGCATIFSRSQDPVTINSTPEGAAIYLDGMRVGKTPSVVTIDRSLNAPSIEIRAPGYYSQRVMVNNTLNNVTLINLLIWPGFIVDAITGNMMRVSQLSYDVELEPKDPPPGIAAPVAPVAPVQVPMAAPN